MGIETAIGHSENAQGQAAKFHAGRYQSWNDTGIFGCI